MKMLRLLPTLWAAMKWARFRRYRRMGMDKNVRDPHLVNKLSTRKDEILLDLANM
jgi:hypothetical protein